jgi:MYXO-CTERM domain-containing protein
MSHFLKITKSSAALLVTLGLVGAARPALAQNLIQNGNFATGDFTDWTTTGSFFAVTSASFGINPPQAGDQIAQADGNDSLSQTFATTIGVTYELAFASANSRGPNTQGNVYIQGLVNGTTLFTDTTDLANTSWVNSTYDFTADATSTTVQLAMNFFNANGDGLITEISVTPVATPEPSTLAFGALGLFGLIAARRRK